MASGPGGAKDFAWLIGGLNQSVISNIHRFNPDSRAVECVELEDQSIQRYNHSAVSYHGKIYIFGGEKLSGPNLYLKSTLNSL
jgi:hypothetical protein